MCVYVCVHVLFGIVVLFVGWLFFGGLVLCLFLFAFFSSFFVVVEFPFWSGLAVSCSNTPKNN